MAGNDLTGLVYERVRDFLAGSKKVLFPPFFTFFQAHLETSGCSFKNAKTDEKSPLFCLRQEFPNTL